MPEPTGISLAWLLDHAWAALIAVWLFLWRRHEALRADTERRFEERAKAISEHDTRMSVSEQRIAALEARAQEDRAVQTREVAEIHKEMKLIRKDFAAGFKELGDRFERMWAAHFGGRGDGGA
jgi:hypothetical protein